MYTLHANTMPGIQIQYPFLIYTYYIQMHVCVMCIITHQIYTKQRYNIQCLIVDLPHLRRVSCICHTRVMSLISAAPESCLVYVAYTSHVSSLNRGTTFSVSWRRVAHTVAPGRGARWGGAGHAPAGIYISIYIYTYIYIWSILYTYIYIHIYIYGAGHAPAGMLAWHFSSHVSYIWHTRVAYHYETETHHAVSYEPTGMLWFINP